MKIVLGGGGSAEQEAPVLSRFVKLLDSGPRVLYFPIATKDAAENPQHYSDWIEATLRPHGVLEIEMWPSLLGQDPAVLDGFDGLFLGGGNTFRLLYELRKNGFDEAILKFSKAGKPVYGGSAGAIVLGRYISTSKYFDHNDIGVDDLRGLDLCAGASIWCHYSWEHASLVENYIQESMQRVITIPENAGVHIGEGGYSALGEGAVYEWSSEGRKAIPRDYDAI
ncbi:MAG: Type 1 glutamine amidotransferase-like domain-containing protein [Desulfobacteraceae bacterium]|nr:Type 1 glutamine amidotransferase-like domain-containing protein [Desulfobacteraceae bacterium]